MEKIKINLAMIGGGLATLIALGGYHVVYGILQVDTYSGASLGALIIVCLAAGKTPIEVMQFLAKNSPLFCIPFIGTRIMRKKVNEFLGNMKFKDLPKECFVSITPKRKDFPNVITRENAGDMTVGEVVAASASVPGLYLPAILKIDGKKSKVYDGGLTFNPPLNPDAKNALFSYENDSSLKANSWNKKARWPQKAKATAVFHPYNAKFGMLGGPRKVREAFAFGASAMAKESEQFLKNLGIE